jgi:RNA polymerase sigma-70 factor (ECF subfamily)
MTISRSTGRFADPESRFRAAFTNHYPDVYGYAARRLGPDDAADAAAATFEVAWRRIRAMPDDPLPWLYGVARRVVANTLRGQRRRERLTARTAAEPLRSTEPDDDVLEALGQLSARDREILRLAAWEGLEGARLGRALGCSPNTAAVRLHRARRRLSDAMGHPGGEA